MSIRVSAGGQIFEFPDGTSQEVMSAALRQHFQEHPAAPEEKSTWEKVKDFASDAYDAADRAMQPLRDAVGYDVEAQRAKEETFQRGVREAERADLAKQDGMLDRAGDFLTRGTAGARAGVDRFASGLARTDAEQQAAIARAKANEETAATQIAGETSWEDVKSNWLNAPKFIAEKGVESLPYMAASLTGPMGVAINFGSNAGQIAQSRAQADGRENASGADVAFAAPFSAVSTALDNLSLGKMASSVGGGFLSGIARDAATEGLTEGIQSAIEYTGGSAGTKEGFSFREMGEQALQGGLVGAGVGGGFGAVQETGNAAIRRVSMRPVPKGEVETAAENVILSPEDIASPIPNDLIAEGKAITATAGASSKADSILSSAGLPGVKSRVQVDMGDGRPIGGVIEDAFSTDDSAGVKIKLDDGTIINDHFADLVDAGVKITQASPTAEADAIAADLARQAQEAANRQAAALIEMEGAIAAQPATAEPVAPIDRPLAATGDAVTNFMAKTRKVESGGSDTAKNPLSSATGRYQFTDGTWLATYRAEFGNTGESPQQILAKRSDGATQDRLMERLTSDNSKGLQAAGLPVTEGNLYLAHFAGIGGARAILKADPNTSIESVLGRDAVNANPFLKGKTAAEVAQWAAQKMGGSAAPVATEEAPAKADQVDPYEKALSDYRDWQAAQDKEAERTDAAGPEMLPMRAAREEAAQEDMFGGPTLTESQVAARDSLDSVLKEARDEEPDTDVPAAYAELKRGIEEWRADGAMNAAGGLSAYVDEKVVPPALIYAAQRNPAIVGALGERLGDIPARGSPAVTESTENPVPSPTEATVDTTGTRQQQAGGVAADAGSRPFVGNVRGDAIDGEWRRFSPESGTLDVPRADMPQIKADDRSAMVQFLKARGVDYSEQTVPAASLKPTQAEFSEAKVQKAKEYEGGNRALLVSSDGYVLDGHHQWMAARDKGEEVRTIQLDAPIRDLLKVVPEMPSATTANGSTDTKPVEVPEAKSGGFAEHAETVDGGDTVGFEAPDGRLEITRVGKDAYTVDRGTTAQTFTRAQVEQIATNEGWSISNRTKAEAQAAARAEGRARFQAAQQNTAGPQDGGVASTVKAPQAGGPEATATDSAGSAAGAVTTARIEDTGTGKSVAVIGASEADRAAIAQAVPKAQAITRKDGALVYAKKHEADIRQALASAAPAAAPATDIDPALAAGLARPTLDRAERARIASEIAASNPDVTIKGDVLSGPRTLINVQTASGEQLRAVQAKLAPQTVIPAAEVTESVTPSPAAETAATPRTPIAARAEQKADVAVTATGTEVPVNYAVVEMGDLVASNTPDGAPNPAYPADRQPRDRTRAASQTQIAEIASRLNPRLLGRSPKASDGAPIISPDGIVESGNGRTLALQRVYEQNAESAKSYRDFIASEGFDVSGMSRPVLVRIRDGNLSTEQVQDFVRAANVRDTAGMSGTETATSDAAAMPAEMLDLYRGGDIDAAGNREFVKSFVNALVPTNERASMVLSDGSIAKPLMARMEAAMLVRAFGQRPFIEKTVDATDSNIRAIGKTLVEMAGKFAKLREAARDGRVDPAMDITDNIAEAVEIIDRARREGKPIGDYVNQRDIFSGTTIAARTESALRMFFARPDFTKPHGQAKLVSIFDFYVEEAMKAAPDGGLFGESTKATPDGILNLAYERNSKPQPEGTDLFAAARPRDDVDGARVREAGRDGGLVGEGVQTLSRQEGSGSSQQVSEPAATKPPLKPVQAVRNEDVYEVDGSDAAAVAEVLGLEPETRDGTFHYSINHVMDRGSPDAPAEAGRNLGKASISHAMDGGAGDRLNLFDAADVFNTRQNTDVPVADLQARLEGYGLARKVALKVVDTLNGAAGEYHNALIKVATDTAQDGTFTLDHEVVHAFRALGMLNTSEWAVLAAKAKRDPALMRSIKQRYGRLDAEAQSEEAVADMFARYQRGDYKAEGTVARVFKMLSQALEAIRNFVAGRGIQTAEGVMGRMAAGEQAASDGLAPSASKKSIPVPLERDARIEPDQGRIEAVSSMLGEIGENGGGKLSEAADWWRVRLQDKMLPVLRVQDRIQAALGKEVAEAENPYLTEELMSGRVGARLERLSEEIVDPLLQGMQDHDVSIDELETYLYARHAQERNARIAKINPEFSEGEGSGMTDIQARAVLNRIEKSGKKDALKALASLVDKMLSDSLQTRIDAGLISQEEADAWKSTYEHYVPLRGRMEVDGDVETARVRTQSGLSIKGKEGKRAFGRRSQADSILSYSILQAEEAIIRAEKNAAAQAFLKLAQANPNEGFWTVNKIERRPVFDKASGLVRYENQSRISAEDAPYTVTAKVNGDEFHVTMERTNPEAVRLAEAMRNLEDPKFNKFMSAMSTFNRYFSAINTRYNPSFVITNALRDVETAMVTLGAEDVAGLRRGVLRDYRKALTASSDPSTEWGRWRREWEMAGGKVYYNQAGDLNAIRKDLSVRIKMKSNPSTMAKVWTKTFDALEAANEAVERAIRLSVYKNAREAGYSQAKAASLSRNVTTNFTRKGRWGPAINSFYAFFNASTQGSATFIRAVARSKKARRAVYAVMAAAFLSEMLNAMLSGTDDDGESYWDKMPEFEKQKNLIIMMPDGENGEAIKIPLAYGLNAFANLGRNAAAVLRGAVSPGEAAAGSALTFLDAFNPVGSGSPLSMISPTALDPFADMAMNENFAGKPIRPNQNPFAPDQTPSSTYTGNTSAVSKAIAKAVNKATGGDDVLPGALSLYPDHIDYAFGFLTGGTGRFIQDLVKNVTAAADPEADMTIRDMPIIKSVVTEKAPWVDKERFYSRTGEFKAFAEHAKQYIDREDYRGLQKLVDGNIPLARMEPVTKEAVKIMGQVRKDRNQVLFDREMGRIDDATARENLKRIEEAESDVISRYNTIWNQTMAADDADDE